ncbi:hypothetical protein GCM10027062_09580 [Nocardioides hungaricus]
MERLSRLRFMNVDRTREPVRRRIRPRGVPNALQDHPVVDTDDRARALDVTRQLLGECQVTPARTELDDFHCRLHAVQLLDVSMTYLDYAAATSIKVAESADCYTVHMTSAGHGTAHIGGQEHHLTPFFALVISPRTTYTLSMDRDSPQNIIRIEREAVERQLSRLLGRQLREPLVFDAVGDLTTDEAARWHGALQIFSNEVMSPRSLIQQGIGAAPLEEMVISTLLLVQENNYSHALKSRPTTSGKPAVTRSIEFIELHLAEPITLNDIARYAQMSPRSIQAGFREDLGTTPITFIRDRRLDAVRRDLLSAMPREGVTVTDVAVRWGFNHLGSFSGIYRDRFGESPSATLRGTRSA